ncbi:hypothetical protein EDB86DRAFT_2832744 [Lactarius hatsudake]|nr:hypothetical protein EDB86DRAFT_2832744 [Lactarius hatsudake]
MAPYDDWNKLDDEEEDKLQDNSITMSLDCSRSMLALRDDPNFEDVKTFHFLGALNAAVQIKNRKVIMGPYDSVGCSTTSTLEPMILLRSPSLARDNPYLLSEEYPPMDDHIPVGDLFTESCYTVIPRAPKSASKRVFGTKDGSDLLPPTLFVDRIEESLDQKRFYVSAKRTLFSITFELAGGLVIGILSYGIVNLGDKMVVVESRMTYVDEVRARGGDRQGRRTVRDDTRIEDEDAEEHGFGTRSMGAGRRVSAIVPPFLDESWSSTPGDVFPHSKPRAWPQASRFRRSLQALTRRNASLAHCVLLPQEKSQREMWPEPSGFRLISLPFVDDIRATPIEGFRAGKSSLTRRERWVPRSRSGRALTCPTPSYGATHLSALRVQAPAPSSTQRRREAYRPGRRKWPRCRDAAAPTRPTRLLPLGRRRRCPRSPIGACVGSWSQSTVVLFMRGSPDVPRCGASRKICELLRDEKIEFSLKSSVQRGAVSKKLFDWPTPQLIVKGELVGRLKIV